MLGMQLGFMAGSNFRRSYLCQRKSDHSIRSTVWVCGLV